MTDRATLERWGLLRKPTKRPRKAQHLCPKCGKPQALRNFSYGKAWVCANDDCDYKRPYTVSHPFQVKFTTRKKGKK